MAVLSSADPSNFTATTTAEDLQVLMHANWEPIVSSSTLNVRHEQLNQRLNFLLIALGL